MPGPPSFGGPDRHIQRHISGPSRVVLDMGAKRLTTHGFALLVAFALLVGVGVAVGDSATPLLPGVPPTAYTPGTQDSSSSSWRYVGRIQADGQGHAHLA